MTEPHRQDGQSDESEDGAFRQYGIESSRWEKDLGNKERAKLMRRNEYRGFFSILWPFIEKIQPCITVDLLKMIELEKTCKSAGSPVSDQKNKNKNKKSP